MMVSSFPSPAADYVEQRLTVTAACNIGANSQVIETDRGYVVLDLSLKVTQGSVVLIRSAGELQFAKLMGSSFITVEGESIEGEALEDVEVLGVATHAINDLRQNASPV
ncbi:MULTISPECIES: hypothetical protein [Klebsiella]|uniref:DNA polymerase V subunit UmuD n=1 Tax=Klebsiella michiganensis TaxID=1134687 RepID=A0A7H5A4K7_9ENTR|nr:MULTISPECIES: hypothetical protein [Klebsiella]RRF85133.1 hypothetical protein EAO22_21605 [Klebsiella pneumoniae]AVE78190.1 hypothetical protein AM355_13685 [Klebsiella oxytoca]EHT02765.1 hypothetical protein HMPREF9686_00788 [Klebsiella michiganensis]EWF84116.1 hypothetical protein L373_04147 [Klebsiella michiganensis]MBX4644037.1 hypothetical protein [Klebsiella michiganensis]